jgi:hypothetical protein
MFGCHPRVMIIVADGADQRLQRDDRPARITIPTPGHSRREVHQCLPAPLRDQAVLRSIEPATRGWTASDSAAALSAVGRETVVARRRQGAILIVARPDRRVGPVVRERMAAVVGVYRDGRRAALILQQHRCTYRTHCTRLLKETIWRDMTSS